MNALFPGRLAEPGAGFGTEDQILHGARAGTPADERLQPRGRFFAGWSRAAGEIDGEFVDVIRHRHTADEMLES